ncbi:MAG: amidohydrolase family protein [Sedimentisphaerales bacterium]|nr:amidohydrolase family protein [Sedimentisphaerales bacterium]
MIVDCHTHINCGTDPQDTAEHLAAAQMVDVCIVLAGYEDGSEKVNKKVAEYINNHRDKMLGFAVVEPTKDKIGLNDLEYMQQKMGFSGTILYCSACGFHPAHSRAIRFYEVAQELGLPVFFHNGGSELKAEAVLEYAQPYLLDEVARMFPRLKIIIGNMGNPFVEQTLSMVAKHENVYADLTMRPSSVWQLYNTVVAAHERGVMDKLLFGSGFPLGNAQQCMETLLGFNMLLADTNLPGVPRNSIRAVIERDSLEVLAIKKEGFNPSIKSEDIQNLKKKRRETEEKDKEQTST